MRIGARSSGGVQLPALQRLFVLLYIQALAEGSFSAFMLEERFRR